MTPKGFLGKKIAQNLAQIDGSFQVNLSGWKN
jgi:hypothetical protein